MFSSKAGKSLSSTCRMGGGVVGLCAALWFILCKEKPPPGPTADGKSMVETGSSVQRPQPDPSQPPPQFTSTAPAGAFAPKGPPSFQWAGAWLVVTEPAAAVYAEPASERKQKT